METTLVVPALHVVQTRSVTVQISKPLPAALGVRTLAGLEPTLYPVFLSAALVVTIPPLLVFLLAQRRIFALTTSEER